MEEKKYYPVFSVDVCFESCAMEVMLVGAENKSDLVKHLKPLMHKDDFKKVSKERAWRITLIPSLFTDKPYEALDRYSYYE